MAETRAKARALRDAVNIGIASFEEGDGGDAFPNGPDLGSGAPTAERQLMPPSRPVSQAPDQRGNGVPAPMSDAQRRYLFRILAGRGMPSAKAHEYLKEVFGVEALEEVTKLQATHGIDELLKDVPDGARER